MGKKASRETQIEHMRVFKNGRLCARLSGIDINYERGKIQCFNGPIPYGPSKLDIKMTVAELTPYGKRIIGRALKQYKPIDAWLHLRWRAKDRRIKSRGRVSYRLNGRVEKEQSVSKFGPDILRVTMFD